MSKSGLLEAICNVNLEDLEVLPRELDALIEELTRELSVATAVRRALGGGNVHVLTIDSSDPCCCQGEPKVAITDGNGKAAAPKPGRKPKAASEPSTEKPTGCVAATGKTIAVAKLILKRGALTKEEIAKAMGWKRQQVAMVLGRSKQHFLVRDDGKVLVAPALANELE